MDGSGDGGVGRCMEGGRGEESDINRILLRYRPIAPKPVVGGSVTGGGGGSSVLSGKRTKRKYVRVSSVSRCKNKDKEGEENGIVTLQLLPERADLKAGIAQLSVGNHLDLRAVEQNNNDNNNDNNDDYFNNNRWVSDEGSGGARGSGRSRLVESWVVVEAVENIWSYPDDSRPILNDNFVQQQLEGDSCPRFVAMAESGRRVEWVNEAYRRMVGCGSDTGRGVVVRLVIKEEVAPVISRVGTAFSCWVKVQYNNFEDRKRSVTMVLPCDAWRTERGGFAWRLDARASLCLGIITDSDGCFRPS